MQLSKKREPVRSLGWFFGIPMAVAGFALLRDLIHIRAGASVGDTLLGQMHLPVMVFACLASLATTAIAGVLAWRPSWRGRPDRKVVMMVGLYYFTMLALVLLRPEPGVALLALAMGGGVALYLRFGFSTTPSGEATAVRGA